jgi:hypothetical protein
MGNRTGEGTWEDQWLLGKGKKPAEKKKKGSEPLPSILHATATLLAAQRPGKETRFWGRDRR